MRFELGGVDVRLSKAHVDWFGLLLVLWCIALVPELAYAGPLEDGIDWLVELLTNGIARSVAIVALAVLGYMAFAGKLTWENAIKFMLGVVLIFGSATLVDTFTGAIGGGP